MTTETDVERARRRRRRALFDAVADRYDTSRPRYTADVVDHLADITGLHAGSAVLEVGCGTGQLTLQLAARGVVLTAVDLGPSMIATARRRAATVSDHSSASVDFRAVSFEDFAADDCTFDLVVFADAFHWVDPDVKFSKSARLLRPGGWLAVLSLEEVYDEPVGSALRHLWVERSGDDTWPTQIGPTVAADIRASGRFADPVEASRSSRRTVPATTVLDVEGTRATWLDWDERDQQAFRRELAGHLPAGSVDLTQVVTVTMAKTRQGAPVGASA